jgi:hypothetical protein
MNGARMDIRRHCSGMEVIPHLVEYFNGFLAGILSKFGDLVSWLTDGSNAKSACTTKHYDVEQGVGSCGVKMIVDKLTSRKF